MAYFISGSARSLLEQLIHSEQSPFFQHFTLHELGPFSREAAVELLERESPPDCRIPPYIARKAAETLGGHPFYLQM
ncbi:hypothetical protein Q8G71_34985, partial [Klebsiella pneumoniae]